MCTIHAKCVLNCPCKYCAVKGEVSIFSCTPVIVPATAWPVRLPGLVCVWCVLTVVCVCGVFVDRRVCVVCVDRCVCVVCEDRACAFGGL